MIKDACSISPEGIHINDIYRNRAEYVALLAGVCNISPGKNHINDVYQNTAEYTALIAEV